MSLDFSRREGAPGILNEKDDRGVRDVVAQFLKAARDEVACRLGINVHDLRDIIDRHVVDKSQVDNFFLPFGQ